MCGLTGILDPAPADMQGRIRAMTARLQHRGPDAEGFWMGDGVALGHRRLAIIDLTETGAQPMVSASGRYVIAFNGEIYNHLDLRRMLEDGGAAPAWRGASDTETLLAAIEHWGLDDALRQASGMFAIALWDRKQRRLALARDRMGEKPLYWGHAARTLVFGSELKALRVHPGFPTTVCRDALLQYLRFGYVPAPRSIHPGVWKLEPGCILEVTGYPGPAQSPIRPGETVGGLSVRRYWSLTAAIEAGKAEQFFDDGATLETLEAGLSGAVAQQMMADVPLGAFLSGGIDSSLIVALMQKQSSRPVRTFTIGFHEAAFNEAPHAAAVARHLGTDHTEITVTDADAREVIPRLPELYDEPFADSSQIPTFLVCRAARQHVTVALSGDGGDELFGGYNRYFWGPRIWRRVERMPRGMRHALVSGMAMIPSQAWDRLGGGHISRAGDKIHKLAGALAGANSIDDLYRNLISLWYRPEAVGHGQEPPSLLDDPLPQKLINPAERMMAQDMRSYLPDDILCKVDRAAMGVSLETRAPFLDPQVIAISAQLPVHMKIRNNRGKWALRQLLYHHVPRELIERPKAGFGIPVGEWLRGPLRPWAEELLCERRLERDGLLAPGPVRRLWCEHLSGRHDRTAGLWTILMFQAWREHWV
ncbi:asparagine synthetase B [Camelimonas fluminis]|uniref:asparagine synthase (glutamine-hydrolyzing) n=1 Tax=Camelimonas fluminis TaxID=1576911 RepID=A0ABV7UGV8_9HYPH|nr:asparagine synthase (glutamine-hydrolyzing) [Camelimonas fluminis]GHE76984.1 asparagine synthetase B [Camelimonas fluminis]